MAAASGTLETVGAALGPVNLWCPSRVNPNGMQNNCVSVSTARLENYLTVEEFWQEKYGGPLPDTPLPYDQILRLLDLTGRKYVWKSYHGLNSKTAFQNLRDDPPAYPASTDLSRARTSIIGLLIYERPALLGYQATSHCINFRHGKEYRGLNGVLHPALEFKDFQLDDRGTANQADIEQAVRIWAIFNDQPRPMFRPGAPRTDLDVRAMALFKAGVVPLDSGWMFSGDFDFSAAYANRAKR